MINESNDTLTESCEGAVNFMVIERKVGSLQKAPLGDVVEEMNAGWPSRGLVPLEGFCFFIKKDGSWRSAESAPRSKSSRYMCAFLESSSSQAG